MRAYEELVDFIAAGASAREVAAFVPSQASRDRVAFLLAKEKDGTLDEAERHELSQYLSIEHLMRLAKARAKEFLAS